MAGIVTNLKEFAAYALNNTEEAFHLFKSESFPELLPEGDHAGRALWRGLMKPPVSLTAMEEFLVSTGMKEPVSVTLPVTEGAFYDVRDTFQDTVRLKRDGLGSFALTVRTDADFIELARHRVTDEHFIGMSYDFPYRILVGRLGNAVRKGRIVFESQRGRLEYTVTASAHSAEYMPHTALINRNELYLTRLRLDYMLEKISREEYVEQSLKAIEEHYCMSTGAISFLRLYQAYLEKLGGNTAEAAAILREFKDTPFPETEPESEAGCLYLNSLIGGGGENPGDTARRVRTLYERNPASYILLKLLFLTNPDIGHYPRRRSKAFEESYARGCRSPLLYAEYLRDLRSNDALVSRLSDLNIRTLVFAARHGGLTEALALRVAYLSDNEKFYSPGILTILTTAYESWPLDGICEAIVRMLMKGQPRDGSCFPWYEKAVSKNIKIIRLYEYYAETLPESRRAVLPLPIRKYFALNNTSLSEETRAAIYANVVRNRGTDPETYAAYRVKAETFAYEALGRGRIGEDYATLYQEFIHSIRDEASGAALAEVLFTERVYLDDDSVKSIAVIHDGLAKEQIVPVLHGVAYIRRYTEDARLLFENAVSGRYYTGVPYNVMPLMDGGPLMALIASREIPNDGFLLHETRAIEDRPCESVREFRLWKRTVESDSFTKLRKAEAREKILGYVAAHPESGFFHQDTSMKTLKEYAEADLVTLVKVLTDAGLDRETYDILLEYGTEQVPPEQLLALAGRMIEEAGDAADEDLVRFCADVFRTGMRDEQLLDYLSAHFEGSMEEMLAVRKSASELLLDTWALDGRILALAAAKRMNISEGPDILKDYAEHGGDAKLIRKYLEFHADSILGSDEEVRKPVAECIARLCDRKEPVDFAMKLALLKYLSQKKRLTSHQEMEADALMDECMARGLRFAFMKNLPASYRRQYRLEDRVFVEKKASLDADVRIRYRLESGLSGEEGREKTDMLTHRFRGIYSKEFTLFYGETLHLTITVQSGGRVIETEERTIVSDRAALDGPGSYPRINRMLKDALKGKKEALKEELYSYLKARAVSEALFAPEESL